MLSVSPGSKLIGPPITVTKGSESVIPEIVTFPVFDTSKVYFMVSPTWAIPSLLASIKTPVLLRVNSGDAVNSKTVSSSGSPSSLSSLSVSSSGSSEVSVTGFPSGSSPVTRCDASCCSIISNFSCAVLTSSGNLLLSIMFCRVTFA